MAVKKIDLVFSGFILKGLWKRGHPQKVQVLSARMGPEVKMKLSGDPRLEPTVFFQ
jgi:hypothetical protein